MENLLIESEKILIDNKELYSYMQEISFAYFGMDTHYHISVHEGNNEPIAECTFGVKKNENCFLVRVDVYDDKYLSKGIGSKMLKCVENQVKKCDCKYIFGVFGPDNNKQGTKKFFEKNGYEVNPEAEDPFSSLIKNIEKEEIEEAEK